MVGIVFMSLFIKGKGVGNQSIMSVWMYQHS